MNQNIAQFHSQSKQTFNLRKKNHPMLMLQNFQGFFLFLFFTLIFPEFLQATVQEKIVLSCVNAKNNFLYMYARKKFCLH